MTTSRRAFLKSATLAGVAVPALTKDADAQEPCPSGKAVHTVLERDHPFIYIDSCMQMWPDADFHLAHRHGVTAYGVTAWSPHADAATALKGLMYWHGIAREHEHLVVVPRAGVSAHSGARQGHSPSGRQATERAVRSERTPIGRLRIGEGDRPDHDAHGCTRRHDSIHGPGTLGGQTTRRPCGCLRARRYVVSGAHGHPSGWRNSTFPTDSP